MAALTEKRREAKRLGERRRNLGAIVPEKVEERRAKQAELRALVATRRKKKKRDPQNAEREAELDRDIKRLHAEIMEAGEEIQQIDDRLAQIRKVRTRVTRRWEKVRREIRKLRSDGPDAAVRAAKNDIGLTENPPGSNWGGKIERMIRFTGYAGPVYWCGCGVCWWVVKKARAAISARIRLGYAGYIIEDARAGRNGLTAVSTPQKGDIGTLWGAEHIVLIVSPAYGGLISTIEANTSSGDAGSQSNGGGVFPRKRAVADFDIFARPSY